MERSLWGFLLVYAVQVSVMLFRGRRPTRKSRSVTVRNSIRIMSLAILRDVRTERQIIIARNVEGKGRKGLQAKKEKEAVTFDEFVSACESAEIPIYGTDFLCRALAVLYCYGGGPGSEHFRAPFQHSLVMRAGKILNRAVMGKDWAVVEKYRKYVRELQADNADWLERTLDRMNIPAKDIKFSECVQPKSPKGS